jgi:hypothetical protein
MPKSLGTLQPALYGAFPRLAGRCLGSQLGKGSARAPAWREMTVRQFEVVTSAALYQFEEAPAGLGPEAWDVPRNSRKGRVNNLAKGRIVACDYREIPGNVQAHFMRHA